MYNLDKKHITHFTIKVPVIPMLMYRLDFNDKISELLASHDDSQHITFGDGRGHGEGGKRERGGGGGE